MKRFVVALFLIAGTLTGCAQNHFNIPAENYAEKVKVLGVLPVFVDGDSDIIHPQKELLTPLIAELNRKFEPFLVRKLQATGNYYAVTLMQDESRQLFSTLLGRREKRDDANVQYNKYFWKNDEIGSYIKKNRLDAVLIVVVSGLTKPTKIYSSNLLTSLETDFNFLIMTAQVLGSDGTILWEYPNFRGRMLAYYPLVNLQYPDFSESEANLSRKTQVRFKSLEGIRRTLEQKKSDMLFRETDEPEVYSRIFDEMASLLRHSVEKKVKETAPTGTAAPATGVESVKPAESLEKPATPPITPAAAEPPAAPAPVSTPPATVAPQAVPETAVTAPVEIAPATESTK